MEFKCNSWCGMGVWVRVCSVVCGGLYGVVMFMKFGYWVVYGDMYYNFFFRRRNEVEVIFGEVKFL